MKRTKKEAEETREKIFKTARKLFFKHGYNATSLRQIAREARLTQGAISWHFKDKKDLAFTLLKRRDKEASRNLDILRELDIPSVVKAKIMVYSNIPDFKSNIDLRNYFRLKMEFTALFEETGGQKFAGTFIKTVTVFLREAKAAGEIKESIDGEVASYTLSSLLAGIYLKFSVADKPFPGLSGPRKIIDSYFDTICTTRGKSHDFTKIRNSVKNKFNRDEKFF